MYDFKMEIPPIIKKLNKSFKEKGFKLYIVGGAVRDELLGKKPKDYDLATNAKPMEVLAIAKDLGMHYTTIGIKQNTVEIEFMEVTTFRRDIGRGRRPDAVEFGTLEDDARRRDLTINALYYDIENNKIIDLVGGINDIGLKRIRTVGEAEDRFDEDPLRKLRALRFYGTIGGKMDKPAYEAIKKNPDITSLVSAERRRQEFRKGLENSESAKKYLELCSELKLLPQILPGVDINMDFKDIEDYISGLAYLLRDNLPSKIKGALNPLKYTNDEIDQIQFLITLQYLDDKNAIQQKEAHKRVSIDDQTILNFGKLINRDFQKFIDFKLSVKGSDAPQNLTGRDVGIWIKNKELENYLKESRQLIKEVKSISNFRKLYNAMPSDLRTRVMKLACIPQNPKYHPEGNVLKHTIMVVNRAVHFSGGDPDLVLSALFHDIGKDSTSGVHPKTGATTHYGHEKVSAELIDNYTDFIEKLGGNPESIKYIVKNHMKMKKFDEMKPSKQELMRSDKDFDALNIFCKKMDKGGLKLESKESVETKEEKKEKIKQFYEELPTPKLKDILRQFKRKSEIYQNTGNPVPKDITSLQRTVGAIIKRKEAEN